MRIFADPSCPSSPDSPVDLSDTSSCPLGSSCGCCSEACSVELRVASCSVGAFCLTLCPSCLDAVGRKALGPLLVDENADRAADARGDAAAMLAAWLGNDAELPPEVEPSPSPEPWGPIPRPLVAPEPVEPPTADVVTPEGLTANQAAVWGSLPAQGTATTKEIVVASGLKADAVGKVLPALAKKGLAVTPKRGHWGRATP